VLSGRLKAVLVALFATILLIGVIGPATTLAADPPGLARFMYAIGRTESGGSYTARNATSGAYGKYQIIPSSWRAWADRYLGNPRAKQTPENQEFLAAAKFRAAYKSLHTWPRVAYLWLTGSARVSGWSPYATKYVAKVMRYYNSTTDAMLASGARAPAAPKLQHYPETSAAIAYLGSWRSASHAGYTGDAVRYATDAGATATFTFTGSKVTWFGPVGPTRGKARVTIDGALVKTVDLGAGSFTAHKAVFSNAWAEAGQHTLVIEVAGTAGRPYVAIDELTVAP
jgi:hypothetical protein